MLKLKVLATGSSGNCYLLSTENETLILDCGIPIMEIKKGLDFDLSKVVGCVVTHSHKDHSQSADELKKMGIPVWKAYINGSKMECRHFHSFKVQVFDVPHDDEICCGFYIKIGEQKFLYVTDFEYIKYSFRNQQIQHLLIECNYQNKYVEKSATNREHVLRGHAELKATIGVVKDNADSLKNVILCHLSRENANPQECVEEVQKCVKNANVDFADKGKEFDLEMGCPF